MRSAEIRAALRLGQQSRFMGRIWRLREPRRWLHRCRFKRLLLTSVLIGGIPALLYFVSPGQINALVPLELPAGNQAQIVVSVGSVPTTPDPVFSPATLER